MRAWYLRVEENAATCAQYRPTHLYGLCHPPSPSILPGVPGRLHGPLAREGRGGGEGEGEGGEGGGGVRASGVLVIGASGDKKRTAQHLLVYDFHCCKFKILQGWQPWI